MNSSGNQFLARARFSRKNYAGVGFCHFVDYSKNLFDLRAFSNKIVRLEISKKFSDGEEMALGIHSDGEFFGEMALLDEGLRSATARVLIPTRILEISSRDFKNLLYKAPVLGYSIVKEMSSRLRETGALMISYLQRKNREHSQAYLDTVTVIVQNIEARRIGNTTGRTNNCCCRCF